MLILFTWIRGSWPDSSTEKIIIFQLSLIGSWRGLLRTVHEPSHFMWIVLVYFITLAWRFLWKMKPPIFVQAFVGKCSINFLFLIKKFVFIYLFGLCWVFLAPRGIFSCDTQTFSYIWNLVAWPGIEREPPVLGKHGFSHWTTREVPVNFLQFCYHFSYFLVSYFLFLQGGNKKWVL